MVYSYDTTKAYFIIDSYNKMSTLKSFSTETSERYSRALFEVTNETNELEKVENDIISFQMLSIQVKKSKFY